MKQQPSSFTSQIFQTPSITRTNEGFVTGNTDYISKNDTHQQTRFVFSCIPKIPIQSKPFPQNKTPTPVFPGSTSSDLGTIGIDGGKMIQTPLLENFADVEFSKRETSYHCNEVGNKPRLMQESFNVDLDETVSKYFSSDSNNANMMKQTENATEKKKPRISYFESTATHQTTTLFSQYQVFGPEDELIREENGYCLSESDVYSAGYSNEVSAMCDRCTIYIYNLLHVYCNLSNLPFVL